MPLRSLFVDFNSYFASVEQQERPELRGKPVAVAPVMAESTCCIAVSYEGKKSGISTGTNIAEARKRCPGLIVVEARPTLYVEYHHRLIAVVDSCVPVTEVCSIDEMSCALRGRWQERAVIEPVAHEIKARIAARVGPHMRCSIGIAPNTFLAKTATDMQKPDGFVVIEESDLPHKLHTLALRDFCGIGDRREASLHKCGIWTVEHLCAAPKELLRRAWHGIEGERIHTLLRGEEVERAPTQRCTVGHSHVLEPKYRSRSMAEAVLHRLLQKAAARLRSLGYVAGGLTIFLRFPGHRYWDEAITFLETQDTLEFIRLFGMLWRRLPGEIPTPVMVGMNFFDLRAVHNTTPRLAPLVPARPELDRAVDALNLSYGKNTIYFGGAQQALDSAPTRIAFTVIPKMEKERTEFLSVQRS